MSDVPVDERLDGEQAAEIPMDVAPIKTEGGERAERGPVTPPEPAEPAAASTNELPADEPIDADPTETNGEAPANGDAPMEATTLVRPKMEAVDEAMDTSEHAPKEPPVAAASEGELSSGEEEGEAADAKTTERRSKKKKRKSRKRSPSPAEANGDRKRKHSDVGGGDEKKKLEKLKEMKFGDARTGEQDTRRFNFRPTDAKKTAGESPASKPTSSKAAKGAKASGRGPRTPEPSPFVSDENAHPVLKAFRQLKSSSILAALDSVLSISPQEVAKLNKQEMIEVMEILFDLNRKRELLTSNRRRLTGEARSICNAEIAILNDLEHLMNGEELGQFAQLRSCGQSMDEMAPFDIAIDPADVTLATGAVRLHVVDLLPPADTPMIGSHDPNWDVLLKHIPVEMRGVPPPQHVIQEIQIQQQPAPQIAVQQPATVVFQAAPFAAEQPAAFAPPVQPNGVHQPPPQFIQQAPAQVELPPTSTVEVNAGPAVSNSMESAPPPAPSSQPLPMDFSVPPPFVAVSSSSQETPAGEPLSPRSAFQNTLKQSSLLNSLLPSMSAAPPPTAMLPPQPPIMSGPPPGLAPHLLPGPPPNLGGPPPFAGGSPNRFVAMPPPPMGGNASRPIPLMSIEHPPGYIPRLFPPPKFQPPVSQPSSSGRSRRGANTSGPSANFVPLSTNPAVGPGFAPSPAPSASSTIATVGSEVPNKPADLADPLPDSAAEMAAVTSTDSPAPSNLPEASPLEMAADFAQAAAMETPPHVLEEEPPVAMPAQLDELPIDASAASMVVGPPSTVAESPLGPSQSTVDTTVASADSTTNNAGDANSDVQ